MDGNGGCWDDDITSDYESFSHSLRLAPVSSSPVPNWWFQPPWKIWVRHLRDHDIPNRWKVIQNSCSKPPTRFSPNGTNARAPSTDQRASAAPPAAPAAPRRWAPRAAPRSPGTRRHRHLAVVQGGIYHWKIWKKCEKWWKMVKHCEKWWTIGKKWENWWNMVKNRETYDEKWWMIWKNLGKIWDLHGFTMI